MYNVYTEYIQAKETSWGSALLFNTHNKTAQEWCNVWYIIFICYFNPFLLKKHLFSINLLPKVNIKNKDAVFSAVWWSIMWKWFCRRRWRLWLWNTWGMSSISGCIRPLCLSVCLSVNLSVCPYMSVCPPVCLYILDCSLYCCFRTVQHILTIAVILQHVNCCQELIVMMVHAVTSVRYGTGELRYNKDSRIFPHYMW